MKKIYIICCDFSDFPVREIEWATLLVRRAGADCQLLTVTWDELRNKAWFWNNRPCILSFTASVENAGLMALHMKKLGAQGMAIAWNEDTEKLSGDGFALASICELSGIETLILRPSLFSLGLIPSWKAKENSQGMELRQKTGRWNRMLFFIACILFVKKENISFLEAADCARKLMNR